jgi:hypothetical protein
VIHEFITCDRCNEDGEIEIDRASGQCSQFNGTVAAAVAAGWEITEGDPHEVHVCPECVNDARAGDDDEPCEESAPND